MFWLINKKLKNKTVVLPSFLKKAKILEWKPSEDKEKKLWKRLLADLDILKKEEIKEA